MDAVPIRRENLALPRFFALIFFGLAGLVGVPSVLASLGSLLARDWRALIVLAGVAPLVWVLAWLGKTLWSGRAIPRWFIASFFYFILGVPLIAVAFEGTWMDLLAMLGMMIVPALQFRSVIRTLPRTAAKPKAFDELA